MTMQRRNRELWSGEEIQGRDCVSGCRQTLQRPLTLPSPQRGEGFSLSSPSNPALILRARWLFERMDVREDGGGGMRPEGGRHPGLG